MWERVMSSNHPGDRLHLLALPREIREKVYEYLFESAPLTFELHPQSGPDLDRHPPFWILLPKSTFSILLTCRTLYRETQERRLSVSWWRFKNFGGLEHFNKYASKARKATVQKVSGVRLANYRYKAQLNQLPNLKYVHIGPLCVHYSLTREEDNSRGSSRPEMRFGNIGWDDLILAVNQSGFDWIAPHGLKPVVRQGKWKQFVLSVDFDVSDIGNSRYWVPATLDVITKNIVRFWDQVRPSQGSSSWPQLRPPSPSACVLDQLEMAIADRQLFRQRWDEYMTVEKRRTGSSSARTD